MIPFIGIGTGRCGTRTLAKLTGATHELFKMRWYEPVDVITDDALVKHLKAGKGEVGYYLLPHVRRLVEHIPDLRIVCLFRDTEDTVVSLLRVGKSICRVKPTKQGRAHDHSYPIIDAHDYEQAWRLYVQMYQHWMATLIVDDSLHTMPFGMNHFNDDDKLAELMRFLVRPMPETKQRRWNANGQARRDERVW